MMMRQCNLVSSRPEVLQYLGPATLHEDPTFTFRPLLQRAELEQQAEVLQRRLIDAKVCANAAAAKEAAGQEALQQQVEIFPMSSNVDADAMPCFSCIVAAQLIAKVPLHIVSGSEMTSRLFQCGAGARAAELQRACADRWQTWRRTQSSCVLISGRRAPQLR